MSRSIKKGPYVEERLLKRIEEMNETGKKVAVKTWSVHQQSSHKWLDIQSQSTMERDSFLFMSPKIWSDVNLENLLQHVHSQDIVATRPQQENN